MVTQVTPVVFDVQVTVPVVSVFPYASTRHLVTHIAFEMSPRQTPAPDLLMYDFPLAVDSSHISLSLQSRSQSVGFFGTLFQRDELAMQLPVVVSLAQLSK
jgi:hypothetical protein